MLLLLACTNTEPDPVDSSPAQDSSNPFEGYELVLETGVLEIPPYTDMMWCSGGVYEGEDVGVAGMIQQQEAQGHHAMLMKPLPGQAVPEEPWDCTTSMESGTGIGVEPLIEAGTELPEGIAVLLEQGQPYVIQSHYINHTGDVLQVRDRLYFKERVPDEVRHWAAPWGAQAAILNIQPGLEDVVFTCSFPKPVMILTLAGHMHEWGTRMEVELYRDDAWTSLYEVDPWSADYRNAPIQIAFDEDELVLAPEEALRITCGYDNTTDGVLHFPTEMCGTFGNGVSEGRTYCEYHDP